MEEDPIGKELKRNSPITMVSEKGKPLKLPSEIRGYSFAIRNQKLAQLFARESQKRLRLLKHV